MRQFVIFVITAILATSLVCGEQSDKNRSVDKKPVSGDESLNTVKTKRGIPYLPPYPSHSRYTQSPYARFPGIYRNPFNPFAPTYALTPGNAVVHSYSASYPKVFVPKPVLRPAIRPPVYVSRPILPLPSVPYYANRYPVFVQKPGVIPRPIVPVPTVPQFAVPSFVSSIPQNPVPVQFPAPAPVAFPSSFPSPTLVAQNGWNPSYNSIPSVQAPPPNPPAASILPPFGSANIANAQIPQRPHRPSNYYLPVGPSPSQDVATRSFHDGSSHSNGRLINRNH